MRVIYEGGPGEAGIIFKTPGHCDAAIKPDQPGLDRRRRPGELSIPARYASIQRVPTGIRAVSDPQLVGHRLAMELFENPRGVPWGVRFGAHQVIELAANGARHVFERRRVDAGIVTLPWIERGRRPGDV